MNAEAGLQSSYPGPPIPARGSEGVFWRSGPRHVLIVQSSGRADGSTPPMEGRPIANRPQSFSTKVVRYKGLIFAVLGVIALATAGWLYWSQKKAAEYEEAYRKGLKSWEQRDAERALPDLRKAAKVDPTDPELWVLIGRAELASNRVDRALEAWEQALKHEPGFKPALFERGKEAFCRHVAGRIPP